MRPTPPSDPVWRVLRDTERGISAEAVCRGDQR